MRAWQALVAVDDEGLLRVGQRDRGVFGGPGDVVAGDGEVGVLRVEVVCVAEGGVGEDGDGDGTCVC